MQASFSGEIPSSNHQYATARMERRITIATFLEFIYTMYT